MKLGLQQPGSSWADCPAWPSKAIHTSVALTEWAKFSTFWVSLPFFRSMKCSLGKLTLLVSQEVSAWACVGFEIPQCLNSLTETNNEGGGWVIFCWVGFFVRLVWVFLTYFSFAFYTLILFQQGESQLEVAEFSMCLLQRIFLCNPKTTQTDQLCKNGNPVQGSARLFL